MKNNLLSRAVSFILAVIMVVLILPISVSASVAFSYEKTGDVYTVSGKKYYKAITKEDYDGVGSGTEFWLTESNAVVTDYDTLEKLTRLDVYGNADFLNATQSVINSHKESAIEFFNAFVAISDHEKIGDAVGVCNGIIINVTKFLTGGPESILALKDLAIDVATFGMGITPKDIQTRAYMFVLQTYANNCLAYAYKFEQIKEKAYTDYEAFEEAMNCWAGCSASLDAMEYLAGDTVREYADKKLWEMLLDYFSSVFYDLAKEMLPDNEVGKIIDKISTGVMDALPIADLALHSISGNIFNTNFTNIRINAMPAIDVSREQTIAKQLAKGIVEDTPSSGGTSVAESEFAEKIEALKKEYPHGKYWNQYNGVDKNGVAKAGDKICSGTSNSTGKKCTVYGYCAYGGSCTCKCGYYYGWQCFGFANLMAYKVFGSYATTNYKSTGVNKAKGWKYHTSVSSYYAGDVVRINGNHSIFITKVTSSTVYYVDCNNYHKGAPCQISWDNKISVSSLKSQTTFVVRMSGNGLQGTSVSTPALTMKFDANGGSVADVYKITTNGAGLWLRSSADTSTNSNKLLVIPDSTIITASERKTAGGYTWVKTTYNNVSGWCAVSDGLAQRTGYYLNGSTVYKRDGSAVYTQKWNYGSGGANGLVNDTTLKLTRDGYKFMGWSLSPDGSTGVFDQDDKTLKAESIYPDVKNGSKTVTLYAVWEYNVTHTHSFSFDAAGGEGEIASVDVLSRETLELPVNTFFRDQNEFVGWNVKRNNDGKWYTSDYGWMTEEEIADTWASKRLFFEYEIYTIDDAWTSGIKEDLSYTFYAVWRDASVISVNIHTVGNKLYYYVGEELDTSGISIFVEREGESYEILTSGFDCYPRTFENEGVEYVYVSYEDRSAAFQVVVTKEKTGSVNGKATADCIGYLMPSKSAPTICKQGAWKNDTLKVLCRDGDFYLCFIPWGATNVTDSNGVLLYLPVSAVSVTGDVPETYDYYTLGQKSENNASFNDTAYIYHRPDGGALDVKYNGEYYTKVGPFDKGTEVRVLFEMNGYYCVQTSDCTGFVDKSLVTFDPITVGLSWEWDGVEAPLTAFVDGIIDTEELRVFKELSDGTREEVEDCWIYAPGTYEARDSFIWINYDVFVTAISVSIKEPEVISVTINKNPDKMSYGMHEEFDPFGMEILVSYDNGSYEIIDSGFELHYEFDELGQEDVEIVYNGITTWLTVKVYEKPTVEIHDSYGYEGQTLTVPVGYFAGEEQDISVTDFDANIVFDDYMLVYCGYMPGSDIDASGLSVSEVSAGMLNIKYASDEPLSIDCILADLYFKVNDADVDDGAFSEIYFEDVSMSDKDSFAYDALPEKGTVTYKGDIIIHFAGEESGLPDDLRGAYGETVVVPAMDDKEGYKFLGWTSVMDGEEPEYLAGEEIVCGEHMILYSVWEKLSDKMLGDVDGNGSVTNSDVLMIFRYIYNPELYPLDVEVGDVDGNGSVTNSDVLAIFRYIYNPELYPLG